MKIYLWNTQALADDLIKEEIPEFDKFIYLAVPIVLGSVAGGGEFSSNESLNLLFALIFAAIITVLIFKCFSTYSKNKSKGFIEVFVCLSFPLFLKAMLIAMGLVAVASLLGMIFSFASSLLVSFAVLAPSVWVYVRLNYWIAYVSKAEELEFHQL